MPEGRRPERVAEAVLRELSGLLVRDLRDPRLRGITLTAVRMDDDLRHGRVGFLAPRRLGPRDGRNRRLQERQRLHPPRTRQVAGLEIPPRPDFEFDPALERAARIDALLKQSAPKDLITSKMKSSAGFSRVTPAPSTHMKMRDGVYPEYS